MARFISATAMGGRLYPEGLGASVPWATERLVRYPEEVARIMASPYPHDVLVETAGDLLRIVRTSGLPAVKVWIREDLEDVARQVWEEQRSH